MAVEMNLLIQRQLLDKRRQLEEAAAFAAQKNEIERLLAEVDSALERMDKGSYGLCKVCHEPIETERLIADPLLQFCLDHLSPSQQRALEADLELARQIQQKLLPEQDLVHGDWEVAYHYEPAGLVSGDYCDLIPANDGILYFILGDVSGKGIAASMLMAHLHAMFRSLMTFSLPLDKIVEQASRVFCESTLPTHYATLVCGKAGPSGEIEISNAGHPPGLWVRRGEIEAIAATGLPLGAFCDEHFSVKNLTLDRGDVLLFYSDGLSEARNKEGVEYGQGRISERVQKSSLLPSSQIIKACLDDLSAFRGGAPRQDDLTIMTIRRRER
ncbi:MAG: SpoIIE family protein phosphatase [Candidatus Aminicenantes bacterium]|nr:SpoIIE family protein phosphatase [Candidatus Aminicenantes bacterium]